MDDVLCPTLTSILALARYRTARAGVAMHALCTQVQDRMLSSPRSSKIKRKLKDARVRVMIRVRVRVRVR